MRCSPDVASHGRYHCTHVLPLVTSPSTASRPRAVVDLHLDLGDAERRLPRHAGDRLAAGVDGRAAARHVDARRRLDRPLLGPAPRDPVAVEVLPRAEGDGVEPLRRRDVAVQPGDDEAGREAVLAPAAVHRSWPPRRGRCARRGRPPSGSPAVKPSTEWPTICVPSRLHAGAVEQRRQLHALPRRVADEVAADVVRHALHRHRVLEVGHRDELVERQLERVVDGALEAQLPVGDVDLGDDQRGVDAVEVGVRRDERRQAGDVGDVAGTTGAWVTAVGRSVACPCRLDDVAARAGAGRARRPRRPARRAIRPTRGTAAATRRVAAGCPPPCRRPRRSRWSRPNRVPIPAAVATTAAITPTAGSPSGSSRYESSPTAPNAREADDADQRPAHRRPAEHRAEHQRHDDDADDRARPCRSCRTGRWRGPSATPRSGR